MDLVRAFSGGDPVVEAKSGQMWKQALDADPEGKQLPFGKAEMEFIRQAAQPAAW